jgi:cephalosporin-C deacetylase-like acetyl esterase
MKRLLFLSGAVALMAGGLFLVTHAPAQGPLDWKELAKSLRSLDVRILTSDPEQAQAARRMLSADVRERLRQANRRATKDWRQLGSAADWEGFRKRRLDALQASLGPMPPAPRDLHVRVTRTLNGDGYRIENIIFESRPGLLVTANLYLPAQPGKAMPGILICHSHHNPKTQGELQDMGMTWARQGCVVLIMDQLGHGERRQHPFVTEKSYPRPFKVGRQDYYFRYNESLQLYLAGESLMGWMVWDLMRGVDLLVARPDIDKKRIILLGAVAGGGDPTAVTAALDGRIAAAAPFNFGGPQPETIFPLPADPEEAFNFAGSGSWESTRNLRLSAREGFLPWVIVGSLAPRPLIYAHEFSWDKEHDPVWARLQKIYRWYGKPDHLASVLGKGKVTGKPPKSSHCNNIGPLHRQQIYPALSRWFEIPVPAAETMKRRPAADLLCLTPELKEKTQPVWRLAGELGWKQVALARMALARLSPAQQRDKLRKEWDRLLRGIFPDKLPCAVSRRDTSRLGPITVERVVLNTERDIRVPLILLRPATRPGMRLPVVVGVAQQGRDGFFKHRVDDLAQLLSQGVVVCLPDLRGCGETQPGTSRGKDSAATAISASELMLGGTVPGGQCRDLLAVLDFLRRQQGLAPDRIALWADSFAPVNPPGRNLAIPYGVEEFPDQAEPMGSLVVLLAALVDERVVAVHAGGGLASYLTVLESPFCYMPHDAVIPGVLSSGDVCDLAGALAPRQVRLVGLVDGQNRRVSLTTLQSMFAPAAESYRRTDAKNALRVVDLMPDGETPAHWIAKCLSR